MTLHSTPDRETLRQHEAWKAARDRMGMKPPPPTMHLELVTERLRSRVSALESRVIEMAAAKERLEEEFQALSRRPQKVITIIGALPGTAVSRDRWRIIVDAVAAKHGVSTTDIRSARRDAPLVRARHEAFYELKRLTTLSLPQIGRLCGNKDHSTVLHGIARHKQRMAEAAAL